MICNTYCISETKAPSVLLIDDDAIFANTLGRALNKRGYSVTICTTTSEAAELIANSTPDKAVVDLRLPDGSGLCMVSALKKQHPKVEIVVLTGYGSIASAVEATKLGAINYLCKPVDADAVVLAFNGKSNGDHDEAGSDPDNTNGISGQPLTVNRLEWEHINRVLAEHDGNISATARALNMHRRTLQRKLLKHPVRQ